MITPINTSELKHDIDNYAPPINSIILQFPDSTGVWNNNDEPGNLYGGTTWAKQLEDSNGVFLRLDGETSGRTRTSGLQEDQFQGFSRWLYAAGGDQANVISSGGGYLAVNVNASTGLGRINSPATPLILSGAISSAVTDGVNGTPRIGTTTHPKNRLMRIWKRTA